MLMSSLQNALLFTIQTIFSFYIMIVLFRFMLQLVKADFRNPLAQFVVKVTNPLLIPLRKIIPGYAKIDCAALVLALLLQGIELYLILLVKGFGVGASVVSIGGLCIWSAGELLDLTLAFLFFATLIQVVYSWIQPGQYHPSIMLLQKITEPLYRPIHRVIPNFGMIDMSPIVLIFLISLSRMLVADPVVALGRSLI
jgi:YggT family protein